LERLAGFLLERGHPHAGIQQYLQAAEHFGRWIGCRRIAPEAIDAAVVERFLDRHLPRCRCWRPAPCQRIGVRAALRHLLRCMGRSSKVPAGSHATSPAIEAIIQEFDHYMQQRGGLAENTRRYRCRYARELLQATFGRGLIDWKRLTPALVMAFVAEYARRCSPATGRVAATAISSLLRFAQFHGFCDARLVRAVPRLPSWKRQRSAKEFTAAQLQEVLGQFDRTTATGRRGYAMALCMADLGLRVSEVAALCLEDVNWRQASICIALSKGRRTRVLPLPRRLGQALAAYLRHDRPASEQRRIFLRLQAPRGKPVSKEVIRGVVRRAYAACGLEQTFTGTHVLRHSAACRMHQHGVPLKQIADLLGHRSLDSTVMYARANLVQLATVALPWPKEVRP
jgi:site-specific recombinase XerD